MYDHPLVRACGWLFLAHSHMTALGRGVAGWGERMLPPLCRGSSWWTRWGVGAAPPPWEPSGFLGGGGAFSLGQADGGFGGSLWVNAVIIVG